MPSRGLESGPMRSRFSVLLFAAVLSEVHAIAAPQVLDLDEWTYIQLDNSRAKTAFGLASGDVNGDGLPDLASGRYVYTNPGGDLSAAWSRVALPWDVDILAILDVDGDARPDMIAMDPAGRVLWLEANDLGGQSWNPSEVADFGHADHNLSTQGFRMAQIEAGGRPELLFTLDSMAYLRVPSNPNNVPWPSVEIASTIGPEGTSVADIDGDGDLDVAATSNTIEVRWYRNPGTGAGGWASFAIGVVPSQYADRFELADFNGDRRLDLAVTVANGSSNGLYWFEGPSNPTSAWTRRTIVTQNTTNSMDAADIDQDGDIDIVTGEHRGPERVSIWENDGLGNFTGVPVSSGIESHLGTQLFDLDLDGDLDLVSIAFDDFPRMHLWRNDGSGGPPPPPVSLKAFYPMNELSGSIIHDRSGNQPDGFLTGGASFGDAPSGNFLRTGGGRAEVGNWSLGSSELSISAWIRPIAFPGSADGRIISRANGVANQDHDWMLSTIAVGSQVFLRARVRVGNTVTTLIADSAPLATKTWVHVAMIYDGSRLRLFQGSTIVGEVALQGPLVERPGIPIAIGAQAGGAAPFLGRLDDVRVYDGALSPAQIQNLDRGRPAKANAQ